jgi:hypothetical protein
MTGSHAFYFVSTPLNTILATLLALQKPEEKAHLLCVDRREARPDPMMQALEQWSSSPFESIHILVSKGTKPWRSYALRQKAFTTIDALVARYRPARFYTCNDRRIEFLYGVEAARNLDYTPSCSYVDDGVYSYFPTEKRWYQESVAEQWLKKAVYGSWYNVPRVVGSSPLLESAYLLFPEKAHAYLQKITLHTLELTPLQEAPMQAFFRTFLDVAGITLPDLSTVSTVYILPHSSLFGRYPSFVDRVTGQVRTPGEAGGIGIKYHPREAGPDLLNLTQSPRVTVIPAEAPFEILLPLLAPGTALVGNVSTALLTAKLIRPDITVTALLSDADTRSRMLLPLFEALGIRVETL